MASSVSGFKEIEARLRMLGSSGISVARSAVGSGVTVIVRSVIKDSPGLVKKEIKGNVRVSGDSVIGHAGLMVLPQKGIPIVNGIRPHGLFLEEGTRFQAARHFVSRCLSAINPIVASVMVRTAQRKLQKLSQSK